MSWTDGLNTNIQTPRSITEEVDFLLRFGKLEEALSLLLPELNKPAIDPVLLGLATIVYGELGRTDEAFHHCDLLINAAPESEWGYRLRSWLLSGAGYGMAMVPWARKAVEAEPENPRALMALFEAQLNGFLRDARPTAERLARIAPKWSRTSEAFTRLCLGENKLDEAESHCRDLLNLEPNSADAYLLLGWIRKLQGRISEASEDFLIAMKLRPDSPVPWRCLKDLAEEQVQEKLRWLTPVWLVVAGGFLWGAVQLGSKASMALGKPAFLGGATCLIASGAGLATALWLVWEPRRFRFLPLHVRVEVMRRLREDRRFWQRELISILRNSGPFWIGVYFVSLIAVFSRAEARGGLILDVVLVAICIPFALLLRRRYKRDPIRGLSLNARD